MKNVNLLLIICLIIFSCDKDLEEEIDTIPPVLSFEIEGVKKAETPNEIPIVGNKMEININADDEKGISKVEAYINDTKVAEDKTAPFKLSIDLNSFNSIKKSTANKGEVFSLKIVAQDNSGNTAVSEQEIYIDNTLPTISKVSLEEGTILNGTENTISFIAEDDQDITNLEVFLNNETVEFKTLEDNNYSLNFDSTKFEDGEKTLKIIAEDAAENTTIYEVKFITDNTGPEITFEDIKEEDIVIENTVIKPALKDLYSEIDSVQIKLNDSILLNSVASEISFELNPDDYSTGEKQIRITAKDKLGNTSVSTTNFKIHRKLITINIPEEALSSTFSRFYIFSSNYEGKILDIKEVLNNTRSITLTTEKNINKEESFMLTFAALSSGYIDSSYLTTFQDLTINNPSEVNIKTPKREIQEARKRIQSTGVNFESTLGSVINVNAYGSDYNGQYSNNTNEMWIELYENTQQPVSSKIYFSYRNHNNYNYKYLLLDRDSITDDFKLDYNQFKTEGIERRTINAAVSNTSGEQNSMTLVINGYLDENDIINNKFNMLWNFGGNFDNYNGFNYDFNSNFYKYRYDLSIGNYFTKSVGEPKEFYNIPAWTLDYTFTNNQININKTGAGHAVGNIYIENNNQSQEVYKWKIIFNSQKNEKIILPELPNELNTWNINDDFQNQNLNIQQVDIRKYHSIENYDEYLNKSLKENLNNSQTSDLIEGIFSNQHKAFYDVEDFFLFKYY
ncbi:Ig-like domain-containing protein [Galbibacter sp. BG1]